jgi:hypothetical protein
MLPCGFGNPGFVSRQSPEPTKTVGLVVKSVPKIVYKVRQASDAIVPKGNIGIGQRRSKEH